MVTLLTYVLCVNNYCILLIVLSIQNLSMEEQKQFIYQAFMDWKGSLEQIDDVCIIGVRV